MNLWATPKTTWASPDLFAAADANRMEQNIKAVRDGTFRRVQGFGFTILNTVAGYDGVVLVSPGSCFSSNDFPIRVNTTWVKNLNAWTAGNGAAYGGVVSGASIAAHTWLYIFVVLDPTTGNTEIMIDDNRTGSNISSGTFTETRLVNAIKTGAAGSYSSFYLAEMYSTGDRTYINPDSLLPAQHFITFSNSAPTDNTYVSVTLSDATYGALLPNLSVEARLNMLIDELYACGLVTDYQGGVISVPAQVYAAGPLYYGEWVWQSPGATPPTYNALVEALIRDTGTIYLGMYRNSAAGTVKIVPISYIWERRVYGT